MTLAAHRGTAFGTLMRVVVTVPDALGAATRAVEGVVAAIDMTCSRFRDDSELSRLQFGDGPHEAIVSPLLAQALATAPALRGLTSLTLAGNAIENAGLAALAQSSFLAGLRVLDLSSNGIDAGGIEALSRGAASAVFVEQDAITGRIAGVAARRNTGRRAGEQKTVHGLKEV